MRLQKAKLCWLVVVVFMARTTSMPLAAQASSVPNAGVFVMESGVASWYGEAFHGRKTANGEVFDMFAMTAAHKTLPFGTFVLVSNLTNRKQVVVRINDRGPFIAGRIIDLSKAAAILIGLDKSGTARVEIRPAPSGAEVSKGAAVGTYGEPKPVAKETGKGIETVFPDTGSIQASFRLQIASYKETSNAEAQLEKLSTLGLKAVIERSGSYHRVMLYVAANERARVEAILFDAGYKDWIVKKL